MEMEELNNNQNIAFDKVWISLFVSIIFFIAVSIGLVRDYKLLFSGVKTTATIVSRDVKESIRASRDKIIIVFQFNDTTGKRFTGREELPEKLVNSAEFQQGMKRTATYLPSDPTINRLDNCEMVWLGFVIQGVTLISTIVIIVILVKRREIADENI